MRTVKSAVKDDVSELWRRYKVQGDRTVRNRLVERYLPLVRFNAERISAKLPDEVEKDDLVSAGIFGLMDAIEAFDLDRGVKFETYCAQRIRGAILDELRNLDWVPRLVRSRGHQVERVVRELEMTLGRSPMESEVAERIGLSRPDFDRFRREATAVMQVSLARKHGESDSTKEVSEIDVIQDKRVPNPVTDVLGRDLKDLLTRGMTRAERLILILYYYEEMTMKEIGLTLDLSESRVSQMHSSIVNRLRSQLVNRHWELIPD